MKKTMENNPVVVVSVPLTQQQANAVEDISNGLAELVYREKQLPTSFRHLEEIALKVEERRIDVPWRSTAGRTRERCVLCNGLGWDEQEEGSEALCELLALILTDLLVAAEQKNHDYAKQLWVEIVEMAVNLQKLVKERTNGAFVD